MGQKHCRVLTNLRRTELVGCHDINPVKGQEISQQYDIPFYFRIQDLLENVDAVSIASPTAFHYEHVQECIQNGVHVLIEKPITQTMEQANKLIAFAEEKGIIFQVGHIERFNPAFMELSNLLETMQPYAVDFQRLSPFQGSNQDDDVILDLMIHDINLILGFLNAMPETIHAMGLSLSLDSIDYAVTQLLFPDGPVVSMTASRVTEQKIRNISVTCRDAFLDCDLLNKSIFIYRSTVHDFMPFNRKGYKYRQENIVEKISVPTFEPLFLELQHFIECILENKNSYITAREASLSLELALRIRDVARSNLVKVN